MANVAAAKRHDLTDARWAMLARAACGVGGVVRPVD